LAGLWRGIRRAARAKAIHHLTIRLPQAAARVIASLDAATLCVTMRTMTQTRVALIVVLVMTGLAACARDTPDDVETGAPTPVDTPTEAAPPPPVTSGDAILIETRITDARAHTGEVLRTSLLGEEEFCPGGTSQGGSVGAMITSTFTCPDGTLEVQFAPTQMSSVQGSPWQIVKGTGAYKGLQGGGSMVAAFVGDDPDVGREVFTGLVSD
jgi:hypothetical protein